MNRIVRVAWKTLYRLLCADCDQIVWIWQPRCWTGHRTCRHAVGRRMIARAQENYSSVEPWPCGVCGMVQ